MLEGPLGGGKTTFVRGLARGLRVDGAVQSPTFQLVRVHAGSPGLVHVDLYRLERSAELADLGLEEHLESAVVVVEWGDRLADARPTARVRFEQLEADRRRLTMLEAPKPWSW
jgi:tRNA threonylcarbamoyladenosine biosynthesis protein TsaE